MYIYVDNRIGGMNMVDKMKKFSLIGLVAVALLATGCGCSNKENEEKNNGTVQSEPVINSNENVIKDQEFEGLTFSNTSLVVEGGSSTLTTQVSNNTGADYHLVEFIITVKDIDGRVITTLPGYVGDVIKNGTSTVISSSIDVDLSNAASIEYSVKK